MKYHFIVNPKSRSGMGEMIWTMIEPELKKRRVDYQRYLTEKRRHAEKIAAGITADEQEHMIVVLGGDGTVNEVINGIRIPEKVTLGYIPIGSSNDFARGLNIPKDPMEASAEEQSLSPVQSSTLIIINYHIVEEEDLCRWNFTVICMSVNAGRKKRQK